VFGDLPRPKSFVSPPGTTVRLHTLKRPEKPFSLVDGTWPEMVGYDADGYFCVFPADAT
jgi:hypothetical protein